ncbi:MAG: cupin domain-containing protein [Eubacteriaceae bacterium]
MIFLNKDLKTEYKENMRGGFGSPCLTHIVDEEILGKQGRMFAKIVMKPGESIGYHQHVNEQEIFYFIEGYGTVEDGDRISQVSPGDVMLTQDKEFHSIKNTGDVDLVYIALILYTSP